MNVIVVGCGRIGSELAFHLFQQGHTVVVLDKDQSAFKNLPPDFRGRTLSGDGGSGCCCCVPGSGTRTPLA